MKIENIATELGEKYSKILVKMAGKRSRNAIGVLMTSKKIVVFGNSGSGKSTLAKNMCASQRLAHLDLDTLAWLPTNPPERSSLEQSSEAIDAFISSNPNWVIEGCYADLLALVLTEATEIIYMDLPVSLCIENARNRPWEPHKYETKEAQDSNLEMLITWIGEYPSRADEFSASAHQKLFAEYMGKKTRYVENI